MSIELGILKQFCANRTVFEKYNPYIIRESGLDREIKVLFYVVQKYYERYEKKFITKDNLVHMYDFMHAKSKDRHIYMEVINTMYQQDIDKGLVMDSVEKLMEKHAANDIVNLLAPVVEGDKYNMLHKVQNMVDDYTSKLRNPPQETKELQAWNGTLKDLVKNVYHVDGFSWPKKLPMLNRTIGKICGGILGCIFSYSDTGKTSFGFRLAANIAYQITQSNKKDDKICYCGNEEGLDRMVFRIICTILSTHRSAVAKNYAFNEKHAKNYGLDNIRVYDSVSHIKNVEKILDTVRPRVMFIDQGTKVNCGHGPMSGDVKDLQILFNVYRELAKQYDCAIICMAQAVGQASDKKILTLDHIYGSRVAIQGELDFAIGIGSSDKHEYEGSRWINVCKNKMKNGDKNWAQVVFNKDLVTFEE